MLVNEAWKNWEKNVLATCKEGEKMDIDRANILREKLWVYANINSDALVGQDEECEGIRSTLETCDFQKDVQEFLSFNGSGIKIKEPPSYVPFTVETAQEYDAMMPRKKSVIDFFGLGNLSIGSCNL
jgi:hypothetical protein